MTEESEVIVCAGPPLCPLEDLEAMQAALHGCPNCRHIIIHADGTETEYKKAAN